MSLSDFLAKTLPDLEAGGLRVGVNWSGKRLTGFDLTVADLQANLEHHMRRDVPAD